MVGDGTSKAKATAWRDHIRRLFGFDFLFVTRTRAPSGMAMMRSKAVPAFPSRRQRKEVEKVLQSMTRESEDTVCSLDTFFDSAPMGFSLRRTRLG